MVCSVVEAVEACGGSIMRGAKGRGRVPQNRGFWEMLYGEWAKDREIRWITGESGLQNHIGQVFWAGGLHSMGHAQVLC